MYFPLSAQVKSAFRTVECSIRRLCQAAAAGSFRHGQKRVSIVQELTQFRENIFTIIITQSEGK